MRSTGLGEKLNVEGIQRGRGNHAMPRERTRRFNKDFRALFFDTVPGGQRWLCLVTER